MSVLYILTKPNAKVLMLKAEIPTSIPIGVNKKFYQIILELKQGWQVKVDWAAVLCHH